MRVSFKNLFFYAIIGGFIIDLYIFYEYSIREDDTNNKHDQQLDTNEFLVLDWTGKQHVFQEQDPIKCDFSHITPVYCQSKFNSSNNITSRLQLIKQCSRLSKLIIRWTTDQSRLYQANIVSYHSNQMPRKNLPKLNQQQYSMVYSLESEIHSSNGEYWHNIDFPIWYHLEHSYPEPATYFDIQIYLKRLFAPIQIPFEKKITKAPIVWISSNCHAYNGRHLFIKKLMSYINIDSYGRCLNNIQSNDVKQHQKLNSLIYSEYKFVLAIENSNCEDYITEKLIEAYSSTSIPIIAGRNGKPDYARFAPKYSYINVYDYKTIKELADYLNYLSNNITAYNEYLWFRQVSMNKYMFEKQSLTNYLHLADDIFGRNSTIRQWLLTKETSRNKYCKLAEFIHMNDWNLIHQQKKIDRPTSDQMCLLPHDLITYFSNSSKTTKNSFNFLFFLIIIRLFQ